MISIYSMEVHTILFPFFVEKKYHIYPKYLDRQAWAKADPDEVLENVVSDEGLYYLLIQQFLVTSTGSKMYIQF